jgi:hypothetical protein
MATNQKTIKCKLDGKQSLTIPISLKKNGRYLTEDVNIIVRGFLKFKNSSTSDSSLYVGDEYQKDSANLLENKTIVYPVLFSSDKIIIHSGRGTITLLPRSEDILLDISSINNRIGTVLSSVSDDEVITDSTKSKITIQTGVERQPYKISIEITIVDENKLLYGQTVDNTTQSGSSNLWEQVEKTNSNNLLVEFYSDIDWIPAIKSLMSEDNNGDKEEALNIIQNLSNEVPFGSSAIYDAISAASNILSNNEVDNVRKLIYILTDNDSNMSLKTIDESIEDVNSIDGYKKVPIISGNLSIVSPITLSVSSNRTDTKSLNKLGFHTGGQSFSVVSEDFIDDIVSVFYGEAVGSLGYGTYVFTIDMKESVLINQISATFYITDIRANASWKISFSEDNYNFELLQKVYAHDDILDNVNTRARYLKFEITLLTGFSSDEYLSSPESPTLESIEILYNKTKTVYLFLNCKDDGVPPSQIVIGVDSNVIDSSQIKVGMAKSDSHNWSDFFNDSQPTINQNGKIVVPLRFSQDSNNFQQEPLIKKDKFTLKSFYGSWDPYSSVTIFNKENEIISDSNYMLYPRKGMIIFNSIINNDYSDGDYKISISNNTTYKIGLELSNSSNEKSLEIYGIGKMYTTGKDLLPPVEKNPPELKDIYFINSNPSIYDKIEIDYTFYDSNFDEEDVSKLKIKWFINGINIKYLDDLKVWNDISNSNDPLFRNIFSFRIADLENGETVEDRARENGESILKVRDSIYCTIQVSDGEIYSSLEKSDTINVIESSPIISQIMIKGLLEDGSLIERISSNNTAIVKFNFQSDSEINNSEIIWYVNGNEFKRGNYGGENVDKLLSGEVSPSSLEVGLVRLNELYVKVIPQSDGAVGNAVSSDVFVVKNALPEISSAVILPGVPNETQPLTLSWEFFDFEINALNDASQSDQTTVKWFRKKPSLISGVVTDFEEVIDSSISFDLMTHTSVVDSSIIFVGDQWKASIYPFDGEDYGETVTIGPVTIKSRNTVISSS